MLVYWCWRAGVLVSCSGVPVSVEVFWCAGVLVSCVGVLVLRCLRAGVVCWCAGLLNRSCAAGELIVGVSVMWCVVVLTWLRAAWCFAQRCGKHCGVVHCSMKTISQCTCWPIVHVQQYFHQVCFCEFGWCHDPAQHTQVAVHSLEYLNDSGGKTCRKPIA